MHMYNIKTAGEQQQKLGIKKRDGAKTTFSSVCFVFIPRVAADPCGCAVYSF